MKKCLLFLLAVMMGWGSLSLSAQTSTLTVADGTATSEYVPVYGFYADAYLRSQVIYPSDMLADMEGGAIQSMQFHLASPPSSSLTSTFVVKIGELMDETFPLGEFMEISTTTVYVGAMTVAADSTWTVTFTTPFNYTGGNLLLEVASQSVGNYSSCSFYGIASDESSLQGYSYSSLSDVSAYYRDFIPKTTFTFSGGATCLSPSNLYASDISTSAATVHWTARSTGTFEVCIDPEDIDDATWTLVSDTLYTFTDLTPGSAHAVYVRANCGTEYSHTRAVLFYTLCEGVTEFPWFEGFEDMWIPNSLFGQDVTAPLCWSIYDGGTQGYYETPYRWLRGTGENMVYEGNASAVCYTDYAYAHHNDWLVSPLLQLTDNLQLSFYAQRANDYTDEGEEISVWISDVNPVLVAPDDADSPLPGFTQIYQAEIPEGGFLLHEVSLAGYTGNRYIAFVRNSDPDDGWYLCLDNVSISAAPQCERPFALTTVATTTNSASLRWTSSAPLINLYYRIVGEESFMEVENVMLDSDTVYELSGLAPGLEYEWYVEGVCSDGLVLPAVMYGGFVTDCAPHTLLPFSWDFESNLSGGSASYPLPTCWDRFDPEIPSVIEYNGNNSIGCLGSTSSVPMVVMLPVLDETIQLNQLQMRFFAKNGNSSNSVIEVGVVTDPEDPATFVPVDSFPEVYTVYQEYTAEFDNYVGVEGRVAFRIFSGISQSPYGSYSDYVYIDDVTLSIIPTCSRPETVTVTDASPNSATLTWTSEESSFMVYYKASGASSYTAATSSPVEANTYTIQGLQANTTYSVYVSVLCSDGTEVPSLVVQITTPCTGLTTLPYTVTFENDIDENTELPSCWVKGPLSLYSPYVSSGSGYQSGRALYFSDRNTVTMRGVDTSELSLSSMMISFYARDQYYEESTLQVGVMTDPHNVNSFTQIGPDLILGPVYQQYEVSLSSYTGSGVYVAFKTTGYCSVNIDDINLNLLPSCMRPTDVTAQVGVTNATIMWNAADGQDSWQVVVGPHNCNPDALTPETVNVNSFYFDDADSGATYDVYVRAECGDDYSGWSNVYTFTTLLEEPTAVPFVCDFEDVTLHSDWTIVNGDQTNAWYIGTAVNNTPNGSYALYISSDQGATNTYNITATSAVWVYRDFLFSDASEFTLSFDYKVFGESTYDYLKVFIGNPVDVTASNFDTPYGAVQLGFYSELSGWNTEHITLDANYSNTVKRIYFLWRNDYSEGTMPPAVLDNIRIDEVECARPIQLAVSNIGSDNATVTFTPASEGDSQWEIMLNDSTFVVNDAAVTITGLAAATSYDVAVRTICGSGDTSVWSPAVSFMTECLQISSVPITWDFESDLLGGTPDAPLPACWNRSENASAYYPYVSDWSIPHGGMHNLYFYNGYGNTMAILPPIDNNALNVQDLQLSFYAKISTATNAVKLAVGVMSDPYNDATFTMVQMVTLSETYPVDPIIVPLSSYTGAGRYIAIKNVVTGYSSGAIDVDDVTLEAIPSCAMPIELAVSNVLDQSAVLTWGGDAAAWIVEYGEEGFTPGSGNTMTVTTPSCPLTGLTPGTHYVVNVSSDCGASGVSLPKSISFYTAVCAPADQCAYTLILTDSYGDGWNGGYLTVMQDDVPMAVLQAENHGVSSGSADTVQMNLCDNSSTSFIWTAGDWASEPGFMVLAPDGTQLYTIESMSNYNTPYTFTTDCGFVPVPDTCRTPTALSVSNIDQTGATVSWTSNGSEESWNILYRPAASQWVSVNAVSNPYTMIGLTPNTQYEVRVQAVCDAGNLSEWSSSVTFTTMPEDTVVPEPCLVPTNLHVGDGGLQNESITVVWDDDDNVEQWNVQYRTIGGAFSSATSTTNSYTIIGLIGLTTYQIQVQADCGDGDLSEWSPIISATTTNVGVAEHLFNSVSLYPNPANEVVNVQCTMNNVQVDAVEVIDVYGKVVRVVETFHETSLQATQINVSGLAAGMYFVRVTTDAGVVTKPFVKK